MLRFEWNALRTGDHVLVHDPRTAEMTLTGGVVTGVDTKKSANVVGIRVGAQPFLEILTRQLGGTAAVVLPRSFINLLAGELGHDGAFADLDSAAQWLNFNRARLLRSEQ